MKTWIAALLILIGSATASNAAGENICLPHPPGQLPTSGDIAVQNMPVPPAPKKHMPPFPDEVGATTRSVCIRVGRNQRIKKSFCEVGQDGPGGTFDGPYSCGPGGVSFCTAASGYELDSFDLYGGTYSQNGDGSWTLCVYIRNTQPDNWRYFAIHAIVDSIVHGSTSRPAYKYKRWWLKRHSWRRHADRT
jgi:hypothetical protein